MRQQRDLNVQADHKHIEPNTSFEIPPGRFCANAFYWYERDPVLLDAEIEAMNHLFPRFQLQKLEDGRLCWVGVLTPYQTSWYLQVIYDHNHPHNSTYGGSIKVYPIEPSLDELTQQAGRYIPHTLRDSSGYLYICTARSDDFRAEGKVTTSGASALAWAAKWIWVFEAWLEGVVSTEEFSSHTF